LEKKNLIEIFINNKMWTTTIPQQYSLDYNNINMNNNYMQ